VNDVGRTGNVIRIRFMANTSERNKKRLKSRKSKVCQGKSKLMESGAVSRGFLLKVIARGSKRENLF